MRALPTQFCAGFQMMGRWTTGSLPVVVTMAPKLSNIADFLRQWEKLIGVRRKLAPHGRVMA